MIKPYAIEIRNLTKHYSSGLRRKRAVALDNLNLSVEQGEIFGYLGPNGAGKTTTIRLILDLIRPTSGRCSVFGLDSRKQSVQIKSLIGNLPSEVRFWESLTAREVLRYLAQLRPNADLKYAYSLAERLQLKLDRRMGEYSTGNKRKVGIVQAIMHRPPLLIMDEPTSGLDPLIRRIFADILLEAKAQGQTVFLSSHVLSEVQDICDRVAILRRGQLQTVQMIGDLRNSRLITITTPDKIDIHRLQQLPNVKEVNHKEDNIYTLEIAGSVDSIIKFISAYRVDDLHINEMRLEDIFSDFYREDI